MLTLENRRRSVSDPQNQGGLPIKGPGHRLKFDVRRVWECPACRRRRAHRRAGRQPACDCRGASGGRPGGLDETRRRAAPPPPVSDSEGTVAAGGGPSDWLVRAFPYQFGGESCPRQPGSAASWNSAASRSRRCTTPRRSRRKALAQREHFSGHRVAKVVVAMVDGRPVELILPASRRVRLDRVQRLLGAERGPPGDRAGTGAVLLRLRDRAPSRRCGTG